MNIPVIIFSGYVFFLLVWKANGDCNGPLGMKRNNAASKTIADKQITASSEKNYMLRASLARLDEQRTPGKKSLGGWCAEDTDANAFLQVDLLTIHTIHGVATQALDIFDSWITTFSIEYSYDGLTWYDYRENGVVKIFAGNTNSGVLQTNAFSKPLTARAIRVKVVAYHEKRCLRMELYGCEPKEDCNTAVGVEDGRILDEQITASSHWNDHVASNARLNNVVHMVNRTIVWGGWCTNQRDRNQFLQFDLGHVRAISGLATQGYQRENYVKQYRMNYSIDGQEWKSYSRDGGSKIFLANFDNDTVIKNTFRRIFARFIRLNPVQWNSFGYMCMRAEIYECLPTRGSVPEVSPPGASFKVNRTTSLNITCLVSGQQGADFTWLKNGVSIMAPNSMDIHRQDFNNGSILSVLSLRDIKYRDSGAVISCTVWYPGVPINTSRNIHVFVNAPRPVLKISKLHSRSVNIDVIDLTPKDTAKYLIRYKIREITNVGWTTVERARPAINISRGQAVLKIVLDGLTPFTTYTIEVASHYTDGDVGPYSLPRTFTTAEDVPNGPPRDVIVEPLSRGAIRVSWSVPSYKQLNGRIVKYEVKYAMKGSSKTKSVVTQHLQRDIKGLEVKGRYKISVRAYTQVGPGPYSRYTFFDAENAWKPKSETTKRLEQLAKVTVTDQNAAKVTAEVRNLTSKGDKLVEQDIHITATILGKVVATNITSTDIGNNLLETISHVMDVDSEVLRKTQKRYNSSARFVEVLEVYIEKGGKFSIDTPNIAVHTHKIQSSFNVMRTTVTTKDNRISFNSTTDVTSGPDGKSNNGVDASITIPSVVLPKNNTANVTVYFVYYKNSKLFSPNFRVVDICEDGFTSRKRKKFEGGSKFSIQRVSRNTITEGGPVIAASLKGRKVSNLSEPITIMFKMSPEMILRNSTKCRWWDFNANGGRGGWSHRGCELVGIYNNTIVCQCDHMTNFAALVDVYGPSSKPCGAHELALSLIAYVGCGLSILGLVLTIFTYAFFQKLRKEIAAKILLHLCTALLCVLVVFIAGVERGGSSRLICQVVAVLIHYFLLVSFMWMLIEAYFMYLAFVKVWRDHGDYVMWKCTGIGWGLPALVVVVTIAVDKESYTGGEHYCRLKDLPFFVSFLAPVVTIILINTVIFTIIMYKLSTRPSARSADQDRGHEGIIQLRRAFGILILVGLTWMFGFFAVSTLRLAFTYLFAVLNCLQGFSIFMFYCVTQSNVRECWWALLRCDLQSLYKKQVYTDSYDRRRLSSASKAQLDAMRARTNTTLTQILQMPMKDIYKPTDPVPEKSSENFNYDRSSSDGSDVNIPTHVTVTIEPPGDNDYDLGCSYDDVQTSPTGSRTSFRSHDTSFRSREPSKCGSRGTVSSNHSTPKAFRIPLFKGNNSVGALDMEEKIPYVKNTLKRTASHTPEAPKPSPMFLRRTKSASSLGNENRFSGESLVSFASTSCESLSSDSQSSPQGTCGKRLLVMTDLQRDNYGQLIVSPQRGSVRGIVGHVETSVDNYDVVVQKERKRSTSLPAHAYSKVT